MTTLTQSTWLNNSVTTLLLDKNTERLLDVPIRLFQLISISLLVLTSTFDFLNSIIKDNFSLFCSIELFIQSGSGVFVERQRKGSNLLGVG